MKKLNQLKITKKRSRVDRVKIIVEKILRNRNIRKAVATKKFEYFFPIYFNKYMEYQTAPFQEEIFKILEDIKIELAVVVAFRGSAKSTIITTAYPLWAILGIQQKKYIIIIGQTEQKARQYLMNIKSELENNDLLKKDLGPFEEEKNQWGATALIIKKLNAKIMISSTEQNIRGLRHGEHRPDLIILDDVEDTSSVRNQDNRNKLFNWFTSEVMPAGSKNTRIILVGNLLHEDSLVKRIQSKITPEKTGWAYREYPIVDFEGSPMWPGKYPTKEDIEKEREKIMNEVTWFREYLLKIIDSDFQIIKREWIRPYDSLPEANEHSYFGVSVDLAISKEDSADYTAIVCGQVQGKFNKDFKIYILSIIINKRMTAQETLEMIKKVSNSIPHRNTIFMENNGFQEVMVESLKNDRYKVEGVRSATGKHSRLAAVSYLVQSGAVLFPKEGAEELITQLLGFGTEKYDDLVDAFSMLLAQLSRECHRPKCEFVDNPVRL
ncbi:MAG: phage terminase large subunit [Patescibacteria group bacterium]|nr:phage terminase large subunit [Patescibacteria group bacterium]MDE2218353.1 phage terminase large subunit [Patescibacteria group bacterium]